VISSEIRDGWNGPETGCFRVLVSFADQPTHERWDSSTLSYPRT